MSAAGDAHASVTINADQASLPGSADSSRDAAIDYTDGISVDYPDWHFNARPSNTEPLLRLNLEAVMPELRREKRDEVLALI